MAYKSDDPKDAGLARMIEMFGSGLQTRRKREYESQEDNRKFQDEIRKYQIKEQIKNQSKYQNPQQQMLQRRAREEDPMNDMIIPEAGQGDPSQGMSGVQFPADKPVQQADGTFKNEELDETAKSKLFLLKLEQMQAQGKTPHPVALKVAEQMKARLNKKLGYPSEKKDEAKVNKATKDMMEELAYAIESGAIQQQADVDEYITDALGVTEESSKMRGVDLEYVKSKANEILPEAYQTATEAQAGVKNSQLKFWDRGWKVPPTEGTPERRKKGGKWYEKVDGSWKPMSENG